MEWVGIRYASGTFTGRHFSSLAHDSRAAQLLLATCKMQRIWYWLIKRDRESRRELTSTGGRGRSA